MKLVSLRRIALGGHDVAERAQGLGLLGAKAQVFGKLKAFSRGDLGRLGVEAEQRGRFDSRQLCFDRAMSACPCNSQRGLSDVEGSLGTPERQRLAEPGAGRRREIWQMDLERPLVGGFEQRNSGLKLAVERISVA
jgi:hypothetical protein